MRHLRSLASDVSDDAFAEYDTASSILTSECKVGLDAAVHCTDRISKVTPQLEQKSIVLPTDSNMLLQLIEDLSCQVKELSAKCNRHSSHRKCCYKP